MTALQKEPGVRLSKACEAYCHPSLLSARNEAKARTGANFRIVTRGSFMGGTPPNQRHQNSLISKYKTARALCYQDLDTKLLDGRLVAKGLHRPIEGRAPEEQRETVRNHIIDAIDRKTDWRRETITGNMDTYVSVYLTPRQETLEFAAGFSGCSLAEWFEGIVLNDWVRLEQEDYAFTGFGDWKFSPRGANARKPNEWEVAFEDWEDAGIIINQSFDPNSIQGKQAPPEPVLAVRLRLEAQMRLLISWLRDGHLVASGASGPKTRAGSRKRIPTALWKRSDTVIDTKDGTLFVRQGAKRAYKFTKIRITLPQTPALESRKNPEDPLADLDLDAVPDTDFGGQPGVDDCLRKWCDREQGFPNGRSNLQIARALKTKPAFETYKEKTLESYVGRAKTHLKIKS